MTRTHESKRERLFWELGAELISEDSDVVEGTIMNGRCFRVGKEFLALVDTKGSGLVVKLSAARVAELVAAGVGKPFAPTGRVFGEWVSVPKPNRRRWGSLLREGVALARQTPLGARRRTQSCAQPSEGRRNRDLPGGVEASSRVRQGRAKSSVIDA